MILLYIDPGSGGMLVQALIALFAGAAYGVKVYWWKIKGFFSKKKEDMEE